MAEAAFNLIDEAWIPVAGRGLSSLNDIFTGADLPALGAGPRQKIAVLKLLLAIAQAARTPQSAGEWASLGPEGLGSACREYLAKWHDRFFLYGDRPFLQMPVRQAALEPLASMQPEVALGNNPRLTHIQCGRKLTDADRALILVTEMSMCLGGKRGDKSVCLAPGHVKRTAPAGPGTGYLGLLHNFLTGDTILATVWLNLLSQDIIERITWLPEGLGTPPWEEMPATEICPVATRLQNSLQGRLVPLARFCLLDEGGVRFTEGIPHKSYQEGVWDPSVAAQPDGKKYKMLWADPEKRPWRSLSSMLAFLSSSSGKGGFSCAQLQETIPRLARAGLSRFGVWSGGLRVSSNSGQQFISGTDDMVESEILLDQEIMDNGQWFPRFAQQMEWLEKLAKTLYACVMGYYGAQGAEARGEAAAATGVFWEKAEQMLQDLLEACADREKLAGIRREFMKLLLEAYDGTCPQNSPRQLAAWAEHRPKIALLGE